MKKAAKVVVVLLLLPVILAGGALLFLDVLAKKAIEEGATYALGVETTLDAADVGVLSGEFSLAGLDVSNPEGFRSAHFLKLGDGGVAVTLPSLRKETIELPTLELAGVDLRLEKRGKDSNYKVILANLEKLQSGEKPSGDPQDGGGGRKFVIREIVVRDIDVHADLAPLGGDPATVHVPIERVTLTDVGSDTGSGVILSQLAGVIIEAIMRAVVRQAGDLPADLVTDLEGAVRGLSGLADLGIGTTMTAGGEIVRITEGLEDVGRAVEDIGKEIEGIRDAADEIGKTIEGLDDLFGGGKDG